MRKQIHIALALDRCATVSRMQSGQGAKIVPQFETAEFQSKPGANACSVCNQPISGSYYRINGRMVCSACTERRKNSVPKDSHAAFTRALAFGAGAAIAGLVLYAVVGITTGLMIGYVSLAVGWMVGKAMMKGSGGLGGRRHQIAAVLFTYAAVSVAAVPIAISEFAKQKRSQSQQQFASPSSNDSAAQTNGQEANAGSSGASQSRASSQPHGAASAVGVLLLLGLASPFVELASDPVQGVIGLVILLVGVRIAWQITRGRPPLIFDGPF